MKVLQIHNRYRFAGGEEVVFDINRRILGQKGHTVCLLERDSKDVSGLWDRMRAFSEGIYSRSAKKAMWSTLLSERPDVVHVHNLYPLISPSVLVACGEARVPVIMTCHNYRLICPTGAHFRSGASCDLCKGGREYWCALKDCRGSWSESTGYALRNMVARKLRLFHNNVTLFIALTKFAKDRFVAAGIEPDRIVVLPNMVALRDSRIDRSGGSYAAFAGRMSPEKGLNTLLEAAARLPELPVRLAGDGPIARSLVQRSTPNIEFLGHLDTQKMTVFYQNARFSVVPSIWHEPFGLVVAEAMSYGLPVIASNIGGLPELVEDDVTGLLFEPGNPEDLASKMKLLWENPDLCRKMGQAGRKKAIHEYGEDVYYKRLMAVYKKAIEINNGRKRHKAKS